MRDSAVSRRGAGRIAYTRNHERLSELIGEFYDAALDASLWAQAPKRIARTIEVPGIHRPRAMRPYEDEDKRLVGRFLLHLRRAMQLGQRLEQANIERQAALDAAERIDASVIVVDRDSFVCYANRCAEVTLRRADGLNNRLVCQAGRRRSRGIVAI